MTAFCSGNSYYDFMFTFSFYCELVSYLKTTTKNTNTSFCRIKFQAPRKLKTSKMLSKQLWFLLLFRYGCSFLYVFSCRWAVSTVMTRQNQIPTQDGNKMTFALIPLWDMCNHCNGLVSCFRLVAVVICYCCYLCALCTL